MKQIIGQSTLKLQGSFLIWSNRISVFCRIFVSSFVVCVCGIVTKPRPLFGIPALKSIHPSLPPRFSLRPSSFYIYISAEKLCCTALRVLSLSLSTFHTHLFHAGCPFTPLPSARVFFRGGFSVPLPVERRIFSSSEERRGKKSCVILSCRGRVSPTWRMFETCLCDQ